jgi:hypothetical protein
MANYTLTYDDGVQGWVSFYSYEPDWMIGMNNYFYTFKGGNLWRHNVNETRNNFYGVQYTSKITSVINQSPLENKLFKTLNIEGDDSWDATLQTDIQTTGFINKEWFEKKEGAYFAFVRNSGSTPADPDEYPLRSLNGIGRSINISGPANATVVDFSINPLVSIGSILSVGDTLYFSLPPDYDTPILFGEVTEINVNLRGGINNIVVDATPPGTVPGINDPYLLYIKNSVAESHGVLGHYCVFDIENDNTSPIELFTIESEVMKSYP